jgi:hypothetical protein
VHGARAGLNGSTLRDDQRIDGGDGTVVD